ncbi:hypothetical protein ACOV11_26045 [Vibrio natriegens]|uniref:hypothetical protein n=1 Tax=Photobacterium ganghwense TaxID=320778 RepID=UPI003BDE5580
MITTERLLLTPATEADIDIYQTLYTLNAQQYLINPKPYSKRSKTLYVVFAAGFLAGHLVYMLLFSH